SGIPPVRWLLHGWLAHGELAILCGPSGVGKSTMVAQLAVAIADVDSRADWCGVPPETRGHVLYVDQEQSREEAADILLRLSAGGVASHLHVAVQQRLNLSKHLARLEAEIGCLRPVLVVLDSMMACFGVDSLSKIEEAMP